MAEGRTRGRHRGPSVCAAPPAPGIHSVTPLGTQLSPRKSVPPLLDVLCLCPRCLSGCEVEGNGAHGEDGLSFPRPGADLCSVCWKGRNRQKTLISVQEQMFMNHPTLGLFSGTSSRSCQASVGPLVEAPVRMSLGRLSQYFPHLPL